MMYLKLLIICSLPFLSLILIKLNRMRNHDKVLYSFCQIRREITGLFRKRGFSMTKHDYFALRDLLEVIDVTIHNYDHCKQKLFNIRFLSKLAKQLRLANEEIEDIKIPKDEEAREIFIMFKKAVVGAFMTYTPFIKSEILLRTFLWILAAFFKLLARLGYVSYQRTAENFEWVRTQIEAMHQINHQTV